METSRKLKEKRTEAINKVTMTGDFLKLVSDPTTDPGSSENIKQDKSQKKRRRKRRGAKKKKRMKENEENLRDFWDSIK